MAQKAPGKADRQGITLMQVIQRFSTEEAAEAWFIECRWPDGMRCPRCNGENVCAKTVSRSAAATAGVTSASRPVPVCARTSRCRSGPWRLSTNLKGVSSMKMHRDLGITQKSAWHMAHRIREMWNRAAGPFAGPVEVDETFVGGKAANRHQSDTRPTGPTTGKTIVVGAKDRATKQVVAEPIQRTDRETLHGFVEDYAAPDAPVYTDDHPSYRGLPRHHQAVKHSVKEYVRGQVSTNGVESFWSMVKRGYHGTTAPSTHRYINEFSGRHRPAAGYRGPDGGVGTWRYGRIGTWPIRGRRPANGRAQLCGQNHLDWGQSRHSPGPQLECVDLIYLDPPFNSNREYEAPIGSKAAGAAFKDTWTLSDLDVAWIGLIADQHPAVYQLLTTAAQSYLCMMAVRLLEMRRVLKPTGSLYLHCDPTASAYLRTLLDAVFGAANFRSEIAWRRTNAKGLAFRGYPQCGLPALLQRLRRFHLASRLPAA